jgi:hypothetical protein
MNESLSLLNRIDLRLLSLLARADEKGETERVDALDSGRIMVQNLRFAEWYPNRKK